MKKTDLKNCPDWLLKADTFEEDVEMDYGNKVIWKGGTWKKGVWEDGIWEGGIWKGGVWEDGTWKRGIWRDGLWKRGTWRSGTWEDGIWEGGFWRDGIWGDGTWEGGTWERGIWEDGVWEDGVWGDGIWEEGLWKGGFKYIGQGKWGCYYNSVSGYIRIGCEEKTIKDWDLFFESDEALNTLRDTYEFFKIYQAYLVAKAAMEVEIKYGKY